MGSGTRREFVCLGRKEITAPHVGTEKKKKKKTKTANRQSEPGMDDPGTTVWWWILQKGTAASFICISLFAILVRVCVSLHPYSGAGTPPKYGDYEAQRHWMEITINLPAKEWYRNSTNNDLSYWGLDYPPLTAYQSYFHGLLLRLFDPKKLLMRWTVLSSDAVIFFPSVLYFVRVYYAGNSIWKKNNLAWHMAMILLNPCLLLIDHGHFQLLRQFSLIGTLLVLYFSVWLSTINSIKLFVGVASVFLFCVVFHLRRSFAEMSAYLAPAFFSYLLGKCLRRQNPLLEVSKLGLAVGGTFAVVWWPYLYSTEAFLEVLLRLVPFERGIYEDYVANFWCTTSIIIKWKRLFTLQSLKLLSLAATISTCLPSMIQMTWAARKQSFLYGLLNCALSFYLFSFQVHEKSILLPLLPASLLALEEPFVFQWLTYNALLSMFPLLSRDKLVVPYIALYCLFILLYHAPGGRQQKQEKWEICSYFPILKSFLLACSLLLHVIYLTVTPPRKYPFLTEAVIMLLCFSQFVLIFLYTNTKQWTRPKLSTVAEDRKKQL